jgi:hypothetical protein
MPSKIILKKSSVAAKAPVAGDLDFGELAINYTDSKLYFKKADGSIDAFSAAVAAPVTSVGGNIGAITDTQLLASIKNVDGAGSGLDADFLDGNHASAFYLASNPNGYTSNTGTVTSVGATAPLVSSGGNTPSISIPAATSGVNGYMSSAYAAKLDGIAAGATNVTNTNQLTNGAGYITSAALASYLPLSGGTVTGDLLVQGISSRFPAHFFHYEYDSAGNIYEHYYAPGSENVKNSKANLRVAATSGYYKTLSFSGDGSFTWEGSPVLTSSNYTSYAQSTLVSGTNIKTVNGTSLLGSGDLTVSASTATYAANSSKLYSTDSTYAYGSSNPYYGYLTYISGNGRWRFQVSPATPSAVEVAYADSAGTADQVDSWPFRNTGSNSGINADTIESNGITYYTAGVTNFSGNSTDGALYSQVYSASWQHQIAGDYRSGQIAVRGKNSGTWQSWRKVLQEDTWQGSKYFGSDGAIYGTIFYDSNNGAYYCDPTGSSRLSTVNADTLRSYNNIYLDNQYGSSIIGVYSSYRYQGVFSMGDSYKLALDGTTTGNLYGLAWSHPNAGGTAGNLNTHGLLVLENGGFLAAVSGSIRSRDDMRSPIFYDSNNTGYYCDPASTTRLSYVLADNWFRPQGGCGVYWESYGRGIRASDNEYSYGNIGTFGGGLNGWRGFGIYPNNAILMSQGAEVGIYNPQWGWLMNMDMTGNVTFGGNVTAYSDLRLKDNVREIDNIIYRRDVLAKSAIMYERDGRTRIGYGAQTLRDNGCPEFVIEADDARKLATGLGTLSVDYGETAAVLAVTSKLTDDRVEKLEAKVARLENLINKLIGD